MGDVIRLTFGRRRPRAKLPKPKLCAECEEPIETARLQAMPNAKRCVSCQRSLERIEARALEGARDNDIVIIRKPR